MISRPYVSVHFRYAWMRNYGPIERRSASMRMTERAEAPSVGLLSIFSPFWRLVWVDKLVGDGPCAEIPGFEVVA